jgi:hypothetical protein
MPNFSATFLIASSTQGERERRLEGMMPVVCQQLQRVEAFWQTW